MAAETPTVANVVSLQISLPQMLDLALGTPEVGVVNFNILHNFLHILLQQINLQTTKVEYRGENANRIKAMVPSLKLGPALYLQEYNITDSTGKISERIREDIDVKIFTEDIQPLTEEDLKLTKGITQQISPGKESDPQTVIFVEPVVNGSPPTALAFKELEQSVKQLQQQYQALEDLSTTPEIVERLKGRNGDPIADIWQFININKRLDASEQGIEKLTTMVQDVIKGDIGVFTTADMSLINTRLDELEEKVAKMEQKLTSLQTIANIVFEDASPTTDYVAVKPIIAAEAAETTAAAAAAAAAEIAVDEDTVPSPEKEETAEEIPKPVHETVEKLATQLTARKIRQDVATLKVNVVEMQRELQDLNEKIAQVAKDKEKIVEVSDAANLEQCLEAVKNVETTHNKVMNDIIERVITLEKETENLSEKVNVLQAMDKTGDINELVTKIQGIEADVERIGETIDRLFDDKEEKEIHIKTLLEQIELLKTVKADKEDLEDALADKADTQAVNRKVSHDQFDAACDDLSRGLEEAIDKLTKQESIWQQALDEVQNEIAGKVDKIEMTPLKDFMNKKLKSLQEKLKIMAEARREIEAAGTKKLLRDVQCISCDKDVVMKTEEVGRFRAEPLPCTISMKPYLTYQLDQVRKQQRKLPHSRNMIQFETAMREEIKKIKPKEEMLAKSPRDHLCNRYCGGSHTIVTPQQKVMRVEHFLTQWGPQTIQLTDGLIKGKDGKMYRSRLLPDKLDVCGPTCWESQISEETRSSISQEHASTSFRKSSPIQRNNTGNERRNARKSSKEPRIIELAEKPIVEASQMTPPQKNVNERLLFIPVGSQDEIALYETNNVIEGK
ncbi:uveal autoantigen with coiled-coil domains and ankyrin repeats [Camponotus floridanus]|uniref:uveal autoantigen with coiled-coil domains and ankyrin repeats n=1 Tax=Camponotus floridanus TaxID=104421 RepID=UPI000DC68D08|nr:uveal autoantigen with coiled-coil domains and ankyrin repeats [Camponotus floridanus]